MERVQFKIARDIEDRGDAMIAGNTLKFMDDVEEGTTGHGLNDIAQEVVALEKAQEAYK